MSYDLMVFCAHKAPQSETEFLAWYDQQIEWGENHNYVDPIVTTKELKAWFLEMIESFPALNGPYAPEDDSAVFDEYIADYDIGHSIIYASFKWSVAEHAYDNMYALAEKHGVGFFDISGSGDILFPTENGLQSIVKQSSTKAWWKIW